MPDFSALTPGLEGHATITVGEQHLATAVGSGIVAVYASPMMIALMEAAAVDAVERLLPQGHISLGLHLDVTHSAPTPPGATVTATAILKKIDGRKLVFELNAHDGFETIGSGQHTRVMVDKARFEARLATKRP